MGSYRPAPAANPTQIEVCPKPLRPVARKRRKKSRPSSARIHPPFSFSANLSLKRSGSVHCPATILHARLEDSPRAGDRRNGVRL